MSKRRQLEGRGLVWGHVKATLIRSALTCLVSVESARDIKDSERLEEGFDREKEPLSGYSFPVPFTLLCLWCGASVN